jgi:peptidoglycan/LPS O-acetylase OafA/YrhL
VRTLTTTRPARWAGIALLLLVGLLGLHLPHYLAETASPTDYLTYPGPVLLAMMTATLVAVVAIGSDQRAGWRLGIIVATLSWVLYVVQETVGLPGLSQTWWEPSRLVSLLLAGVFVVLAARQLAARRR